MGGLKGEDGQAEELPAGLSMGAVPIARPALTRSCTHGCPCHTLSFSLKKNKLKNLCHLTKMFQAFWVLPCD